MRHGLKRLQKCKASMRITLGKKTRGPTEGKEMMAGLFDSFIRLATNSMN